MIFKNKSHLAKFNVLIEADQTKETDSYRMSFFYLIALSDDLTSHIKDFYDFDTHRTHGISPEEPFPEDSGWLTHSGTRLYKLALNLYNDHNPADVSEVLVSWGEDFGFIMEGLKIRFIWNYCETKKGYLEDNE